MSGGMTMHTTGHPRDIAPGPWGVGVSMGGRVKVQVGLGAEPWGLAFVRDHAPRAILPGDWPDSAGGHHATHDRGCAPMNGYVIRRDGGAYVAPPGQEHSYTLMLDRARIFATRAAAERERCPGNEQVWSVDECLQNPRR